MYKSTFLKKLHSFSLGASAADMAMLLLVFFMATTTAEPPKGVTVDLPQALTQGAEQDSIYISISKDGIVYLDGKETSMSELSDQLALRQNEKDRIVSITADKDLDYAVIANVINVLRQYDFLNVMFIANPKEGL